MSERQWKRWEVMERLRWGALTSAEAAGGLGRQVRRVRRGVERRGRAGVVHANRGRAPTPSWRPWI